MITSALILLDVTKNGQFEPLDSLSYWPHKCFQRLESIHSCYFTNDKLSGSIEDFPWHRACATAQSYPTVQLYFLNNPHSLPASSVTPFLNSCVFAEGIHRFVGERPRGVPAGLPIWVRLRRHQV
jgi:hypothetical protein